MTLPIPSRGQRVDREHLVARGQQRLYLRAPISLNTHHDSAGDFVCGQVRPVGRRVGGN